MGTPTAAQRTVTVLLQLIVLLLQFQSVLSCNDASTKLIISVKNNLIRMVRVYHITKYGGRGGGVYVAMLP